MKKRNIVLGFLLSFVCIFSVFGLVGCGEKATEKINKSFDALYETYQSYPDVFVEGEVLGLETQYKITFGEKIDGYISGGKEGFAELYSLYGVNFAISNKYIDDNREYLCKSLKEEDLSKDTQHALEVLNKSLTAYTKQIQVFVKDRKSFVDYFNTPEYEENFGETDAKEKLKRMKQSYGKLVEQSVEVATDVAETVEATEIFDLLKDLEHQTNDIKIVKEFVQAKMLHLFTDFKIVEIANKLYWDIGAEGDSRQRIQNLDAAVDVQYQSFCETFVLKNTGFKNPQNEEAFDLAAVLDCAQEFFLEANSYSKALEEFDLYTFAVSYGNKMEDYLKKNKLAEVYLQKIEQFVSITLPSFMKNFAGQIYEV